MELGGGSIGGAGLGGGSIGGAGLGGGYIGGAWLHTWMLVSGPRTSALDPQGFSP